MSDPVSYTHLNVTSDLTERLEYELSVIESMGYVEYFLIVWDFINFAKTNGIMVGPGSCLLYTSCSAYGKLQGA